MSKEVTWTNTQSPYAVLGLSRKERDPSVADIRAAFKQKALETHPDKQVHRLSDQNASDANIAFVIVRQAAELLLDPFSKAAYDQREIQDSIRTVGAVSDIYELQEGDFDLVEVNEEEGYSIYQRECRCGGLYEFVVFNTNTATCTFSECDTCSLVVQINLS